MKNGFLLYYTQYETVKLLTQQEKGELLDAIFQFNNGGISFEMSPKVELVFSMIKTQFVIDSQKREEEKQARSSAGKKGNEVRRGNRKASQTSQSDNSIANIAVNVNDNVNVNDKVKEVIDNLKEGNWLLKKYPDIDMQRLELQVIEMLERENNKKKKITVWKSFAGRWLDKSPYKKDPQKEREARIAKQNAERGK